MVIVVMAMDKASGTIVAGPDLVSRGFVYVRDAEELMLAAERRVEQVLEDCEVQRIKDWTTIKQNVRDALGKFFYDKTRRPSYDLADYSRRIITYNTQKYRIV